MTRGMVSPTVSLCSANLAAIAVVEMQIEVFNFSGDHVIKRSHDLVGWVL